MIIGRNKELKVFENAVKDNKSHFIAVYGRRRVGKTFLIREAFGHRFTFQHAGLSEGDLKEQVFAFETSIADSGGKANEKTANFLQAFEDLKELVRSSGEKKKVIFIDELSWMDTRNGDLLTALEHFWNGWASARNDIVLIVCASATSWMLSKVIHNKGGLYNRLTDEIHLRQFKLAECEEFVRSKKIALNRDQILQYYMVFGGVPYYWEFVEKGFSVPQIIDRMFFEEDAPLRDEYKYLYSSVFKNPDVYLKIINALAKKKAGMTREEIAGIKGISNSGDLTMKLDELQSCGFVRKYNAFGMKKKGALYQLVDFFTLFYYEFLDNEPSDDHYFTNQINTPAINTWKGLAFERVCMEHLNQIKMKLGISGVQTEANSWYCRPDPDKGLFGSQIDLIIVRADRIINLCEMKYSDTEYMMSKQDDDKLKKRINDLVVGTGTKNAIFPTLVTNHGLVDNSYSDRIQAVVTADDLFIK
ncbi:MAG: ATP-binding protein [Lachnospiraceae bacterium]|nr:ATP-binding protein [Lachnospiraceae bacterium]